MSLLNTQSHNSSNGALLPDRNGNGHDPQRIVKSTIAAHPSAERIAVISHELRNSLAVVRNAARLLRSKVDTACIERARTLIERHVNQMNLHIEHLLDPQAVDRRDDALLLSYVDLRTILQNAVDAIASDCSRRGHRLVVNLPDEAQWVHADAAGLERVFLNLLTNAAKYTPGGGEISLTLERLGKHASIRIRDTGIGIAPAQLSRIFGMSVQVDSTSSLAEGGHGIGLAVVRDLVEMHGGTVGVASAGLGFGSEFNVLLPLWE